MPVRRRMLRDRRQKAPEKQTELRKVVQIHPAHSKLPGSKPQENKNPEKPYKIRKKV